jgi:hypothetical protein
MNSELQVPLLAEAMIGLKKLHAPGLDISQGKEFAQAASVALHKTTLLIIALP